jgi:hypothetical protein
MVGGARFRLRCTCSIGLSLAAFASRPTQVDLAEEQPTPQSNHNGIADPAATRAEECAHDNS